MGFNNAWGRDKFGREQKIVGIKCKDGREYGRGFLEVGNQLFKVEVSPARKDGVQAWVRITKMPKQNGRSGYMY